MSLELKRDAEGRIIAFICRKPAKPKDHECNFDGEMVEIPGSDGCGHSATCSVCGRMAFNEWDIW